jgi:alpha-L-fucosidase
LVLYGEEILPSPWGHGFPWGDAVVRRGESTRSSDHPDSRSDIIYLLVYEWPLSGVLHLPGVKEGAISSATLLSRENLVLLPAVDKEQCDAEAPEGKKNRSLSVKPLKMEKENDWITIHAEWPAPEKLVSVIALEIDSSPSDENTRPLRVDGRCGVDPELKTEIHMDFAHVQGGAVKSQQRWMEKFGEWKSVTRVHKFANHQSRAVVPFNVHSPGWYSIHLRYSCDNSSKNQQTPKRRIVWRVELDSGETSISNEQGCSAHYETYPIGWLMIPTRGLHELSIFCPDEGSKLLEASTVSLQSVLFEPVLEISGAS